MERTAAAAEKMKTPVVVTDRRATRMTAAADLGRMEPPPLLSGYHPGVYLPCARRENRSAARMDGMDAADEKTGGPGRRR